MNTIRCSECNKLLPESASYCSRCGVSTSSPGQRSSYTRSQWEGRGESLNVGTTKPTATWKLPPHNHNRATKRQRNTTNFSAPKGATRPLAINSLFHMSSRASTTSLWENAEVLENEPTDEWQEAKRPTTWHKNVAPLPNRANAMPLPPRPARVRPPMWNTWRRLYHRIPPTVLVWISLLVFLSLIFGGASGIVVTLGRSAKNEASHPAMLSLQATPSSVAVGATVMLEGKNFSPHGKIGLMRDTSIPIFDTANTSFVDADSDGDFSDTIAITPDWEAGIHTINAEDAFKHKVASFSLMVTGHATSLRPAHLFVSVDALNLGSGDQTTNTNKAITLTNFGGSNISWQANCPQSWIAFTPPSGTIASNHSAQVIISLDRSQLKTGSYSTQVNIFSNGGDHTVSVKATVTASLPDQKSLFHLTPEILSFTAVDGGPSPATQLITVSNSSLNPLQWQAATNAKWLSISPQSTIIQPSDSQPITVGVNSNSLLPGIYEGVITLSRLEPDGVADSPQTVFVMVTITPQCALQVMPGQLSFTSIYQQAPPEMKTISIGTSQGCGMHVAWYAVSNASWLNIDAIRGNALASPKVSINLSGLAPGAYSSSIIFSSNAGTQTLPVNLLVKPICTFTVTPNSLNITGIAGQATSILQRQVTLLPSSSCANTLNWVAMAATTSGGNWLSASSTGTASLVSSGTINISTALANLNSGNYTGSITIIGIDSITKQVIGLSQVVQVNINVRPPCILQTPFATQKAFTTTAGSNPPSQTFTLSVAGTCPGAVTITPNIQFISGTGWLSITADTTTITSVGHATFTVTATAHSLAVGTYKATILLRAVNASGAITNSPQRVDVTLNVNAPPAPIATLTPTPTPTQALPPIPTGTATK